MIKEWRSHRGHDWTVLSFPKRDKTILYNATTKKYGIYEGTAKPLGQRVVSDHVNKNYKLIDLKKYRYLILGLAIALGVSLGYNLYQIVS